MPRSPAALLALVLALASLAAVAAQPAAAHGGGNPAFHSLVTSAQPTGSYTVTVLDRDDRLRLTRTSAGEVVVLGYEQEPYLRFTADGVFQNEHSPATYLNEDRLGNVALPAKADAKAAPSWERVADGSSYEWHDHRIHWMGAGLPPAVQRDKTREQRVFTWTVPLSVDGAHGAIGGELDYVPVAGGDNLPMYFVGGVIGLFVLAGLIVFVRDRLRPAAAPN